MAGLPRRRHPPEVATADARRLSPFGQLLRQWRRQRGVSQLGLATEADVSSRHLSFLETGRASPSREMVLRLAEALEVPLRERNGLLAAAGFASIYGHTELEAPEMEPLRRMLDFILERHAPFPALLLDRCWRVLKTNAVTARLFGALARSGPPWDEEPWNLLRITLHPQGLQPLLANFDEVAAVTLTGLQRSLARSGHDPELAALYDELQELPGVGARGEAAASPAGLVLPLHVKRDDLEMRLFSAITVVASPQDVTLEELRIESIMPADAASEALLRGIAAA